MAGVPTATDEIAPDIATVESGSAGEVPSRRRARIALILLLLTYMMSYVDRTALGVLQEGIKQELKLSDWQLGLLSGPAFALLYSISGIPLARLAERRSRPLILMVSLWVWSLMTMMCGVTQSYAQLLIARVGVGVGEAGGNPAAHSLIGDLFPPQQRGRAVAIYSFGVPVGAFLGSALAGVLAHHYGWRATFLFLGPPGLLLGLAVLFLMPSVQRGRYDTAARQQTAGTPPPLRSVLATFIGTPALRQMAAGSSIIVLAGYGISAFLPSFLIRRHGLPLETVGLIAGLVNGVGAGAGTLLGGFAIDRLASRDPRLYAWLPAMALLFATPCLALGFLADNLWLSTPLLMIGTAGIFIYIAPTFAQLQNMFEARMRATAASIMYLVINLVGLGLGPPVIGLVSDRMTRLAVGQMRGQVGQICSGVDHALPACRMAMGLGITYALILVSLTLFWAALHFWLAGRALGRESNK